jgi:broad specificity phosphatase PhoE
LKSGILAKTVLKSNLKETNLHSFFKRSFSNITIMRHAESIWNSPKIRIQGQHPHINLSEAGRRSVQPTLAHLKKPTVLVVSDLVRTHQTAEAWFGVPFDDKFWQIWMKCPDRFEGFPNGENLAAVADRTLNCIASLCIRYADTNERVCVITHGVVMRVLKCFLAQQELKNIWSHQVTNLEQINLTHEQIKQFEALHQAHFKPPLYG